MGRDSRRPKWPAAVTGWTGCGGAGLTRAREAVGLAWSTDSVWVFPPLAGAIIAYIGMIPVAASVISLSVLVRDNIQGSALIGACWFAAAAACFFVGIAVARANATQRRLSALRALAVDWVRRWYPSWYGDAKTRACEFARSRFQLDPSVTDLFALSAAGPKDIPDLPPRQIHLYTLGVGPFLGLREGSYFDVYRTSLNQAVSETPEQPADATVGEKTLAVKEREVHYSDVVMVDYMRSDSRAASSATKKGSFVITLSSGHPIEFPTDENGTDTAIAAIRTRTRSAKIGGG